MSERLKIVILSGAGISAESGIDTFRGVDGLWEGHRIEDVATPFAFQKNPELVLEFYNIRRAKVIQAQPNEAHLAISRLSNYFDVHVITQNVDDLHERAGAKNVLHLHGEILKMRSATNPNLIYPIFGDIHLGDLAEDGQQLRPHIVWFHEEVPMLEAAAKLCESADIFIIVGTSLNVYPAAGLHHYVPNNAVKLIVDTHIPKGIEHYGFKAICEKASVGMLLIEKQLIEEFIS